ncbi:NUDIX domain-containing protein [Herbiconiux sp. L3-i23]|uniref:NUDIX domain-containing protein n=1 Tax=Herbiconiux sp. L3-i23 TaxID=2905871 RepID=UPI00207345E9|nr:NUDIX domain-containing protein [Herbiconiux sp. L3-i23]
MPTRRSAGVLLFRRRADGIEVLLGHMGGPFWARKDVGAWSIPKGEPLGVEDLESTARREFEEEIGQPIPSVGPEIPLGSVQQSGGKTVTAWAFEGDLDVSEVVSNTFELEWPPRSGKVASYPEVDRAAWLSPDEARRLIVKAQAEFIDRLEAHLAR